MTTETNPDSPLGQVPLLDITKIMVPLDLSEPAHKALCYAIRVAQQFDAEIQLVHVVTEIGYDGLITSSSLRKMEDELQAHAREELDKMVRLEDQFRIKIRAEVVVGEPAREIARLARGEETDLILISTEGRTGLARALLGSTAEKILRHAPCPVLVVRDKEHEFIDEQPAS